MTSIKLIQFKTDKSGITIRIPRTLLNFVAKRHPETPVKILNSQKFMEKVAEELEHNIDYSPDSGLTGFQRLIDRAIEEVASDGEFAEYKDLE